MIKHNLGKCLPVLTLLKFKTESEVRKYIKYNWFYIFIETISAELFQVKCFCIILFDKNMLPSNHQHSLPLLCHY